MPANNPRQPRRSWKDDKPAGARPGPAQRGWQKEQATPGGKKGPLLTRRGKIALAAGGLLIGVIVLALVLLWPRRIDPPRFVLVGAGYETNLAVPENVHGVRGLDQLKDWADGYNAANGAGSPAIDLKRQELTTEGGDPFDAALKGSNATKVIVYVAVHGAADSQGPYLIPHDANPKNNAYASYRVGKALAALKALPPGTKKLLILDTTSVESDPTLGLLHNDFVRALLEDKKALTDVPNLAVMIASDVDQRSWVSEEWGTSAFTHFVVEGLKGAAAVNGEVTAQSLYDYVKKEVEQWARDNRGALQTPYLFDDAGIASGMELFAADSGKYTPPVAADLPPFAEPSGLRAAWKARGELEASQPSPAVYTPQLWRQYLDTLKRYEDLLRANDAASAMTMAGELTKLIARIGQSLRNEREALANSLAMPAAFGWPLADADFKRKQEDFTRLWEEKLKGDDYARKLKDWQETTKYPQPRHLMRLRMDSLLLRQALQSEADFTAVCDILPRIDDELAPRRPAEAHFALMLNRHLPKGGRDWSQMKKVLEVRLQAEEAALGFDAETRVPAYSEQVLPWIQSDTGKPSPDKASVERADAFRRVGEDLTFASARKAADATAATDKAKAEYDDLQKKAATVRQALAARDKALAELPYYTVWFATLPFDEGEETQHVALWDTVHRLCVLLEKPNIDKAGDLAKPAKEVEDGLRLLATRFRKSIDVQADTQQSWHEINNLLQVPFIPHDRRMELLTQLRATSHRLNATKASGVTGVPPKQNSANEEKAAQRRGRLALAVLGKNHPASKDAEPAITRPDESAWGRSLAKAGERVAEAYRQMAVDVYANTEKGREAPLKEAHTLLRPAALQARQLSGAAAASWPQLDPVGENRNADLHDLLAYQARRTFDDYWGGEDPKQPYYREAGLVYLLAAAPLAGSADAALPPTAKKARLADFDRLTALLGQDDALTPRWYDGPDAKTGPALLYITDEDRVTRRFRLDKATAAPDGIPVAWTEVGPGLKPAKPEDLERRALVRDKNDAADAPLEYDLVPKQVEGGEALPKEKSRYAFTGFFRGRVATLETTTYLFHQPEITSYQPEFPKTGRIAIRSSQHDYERFAAANSQLVIVLDYSGSMNEITKETAGKAKSLQRSRKQEALAALKKCLVKVPNGVRVTLLTFSEEGGGGGINAQWKQVEWKPSSEAVTDRIQQLAKLEPAHKTPLARATAEAKDYFSPGFEGTKTVLVITDGGDSEFPDPKDPTGRALIAQHGSMQKYLLKQYAGSSVQVNVIGIETDSLEGLEKEGLEMYRPAIKALGGEFVPVTESAKLAEQIEKFLLQIHYRLDDESGHSPSDDNGDVSRSQENYRWMRNLAPGTYMANLLTNRRADKGNEKKAVEQRVRLERGDALVLQLLPVPDSKQFMLRREMYAESHGVTNLKKVFAQKEVENSWLVSVLQNQKFETGRSAPPLKLMTVIEKRDSPAATPKTPLQLVRPRFVWFNVSTADAPRVTPGGLRFYPLADYPAAAYSLDLPEWQETKESVLDLWWTEDAPPDCGILRPEAGKRLMDLRQHALEVRTANQDERTRIVVESIAYKPMRVELKPTDFRPDVDCVVVRLRWDPAKSGPFFALLPEELRATGSEHRFYLEAGKYTGVFYNVSEDKLKALEQLPLYSVEGAKLKAHKITDLKVGTPNTTARPEKPHD